MIFIVFYGMFHDFSWLTNWLTDWLIDWLIDW